MTVHRLRYSIYGVTFIAGLVVLVMLTIAEFKRDFTSSVPLHLKTSRIGLLLDDGSAVKMRGVTIGHVDSIKATRAGADVDLAITPDQLHLIPSGAKVQIVPPTLFGGKYVQFSGTGPDPISAGSTIDVSHVTVEINNTFSHLMDLLAASKPAKVSAALSALANTLDGRGEETGRLLVKLDTYLKQINPELGTLERDLPPTRSVLDTYSSITPKLLDVARNVTTTSDSIQDNRVSLDAFLLSLTTVGNHTTTFVQQNKANLTTALDVLQPGLRTAARYAPEFPCLFRGLVNAIPLAEAAVGGKQPGLGVLAEFLPPEATYKYPKDLPYIRADRGPRCYGLPKIPIGKQVPHQVFNVGTDPYQNSSPTPGFTLPSALQLLFGPISGASQ